VKTPAPETASGRRKLATKGQALKDGSEPIPDLPYLKKAIRSVGRLDPSKRPALAALIRKRAKELKATNAPGVKGTWAFQAANDSGEAIEMAAARRMPVVRGAADVQMRRTGPGAISVQHKSTGMKIGTVAATGKGYQATHATGAKAPASGSQQGALAGLIAMHNRLAAGSKSPMAMVPAQQMGSAVAAANNGQQALDFAGSLPVTTAASSSDGPRVTTASGSGSSGSGPSGLSPYAAAIYRKLLAKGMKPAVAMSFAKRADAMHEKAQGKAA
jgi:hypothetical protein